MTDSSGHHTAYLGIGGNIGDTKRTIDTCVALLGEQVGRITHRSQWYESEPWGFASEHRFTTIVVALDTTLNTIQLLDATQDIERRLGRTEKSQGAVYHDRTIDIDLLLYDNLKIDSLRLTLPHPLMLQRRFVTVPLVEVLKLQQKTLNEIWPTC